MSKIKLNAPEGISVGLTSINSIDSANNATFSTLSVSGSSTVASLSAKFLTVSGSATFSTIPTSPTPAVNNNSTQSATTAWYHGQKANAVPLMAGVATIGSSTRWSPMDHVHPHDTTRLTVANPSATGSFTLTGNTVTVDTPVLNLSQTWNSSGVAFSGIKLVITDTASSESSKPLDLTIGLNKFGVNKNCSIVQILASPNIARDIVGVSGSRHIREYQDLNDYNVAQGIGGATTNTENFEWGFTWNAKWNVATSSYVKDRSNAGDHALMFRADKKFRTQWWFSDGTTANSAISWVKRVDFDLPASTYSFTGTINTTTLNVTGNINTGTWNATPISIGKGGTGRTTIGSANQFSAVNAAGNAIEYKSFTSSDNSISITYPSAGLVDIKLVGTLPGNINFSGDLSVGGSPPNHKFLVLAASGNTDIKGTLNVAGSSSFASTLNVSGDFSVNTGNFKVVATSGNTTVAGTFAVSGVSTLNGLRVIGSATVSSLMSVAGDFSVGSNKFKVFSSSGNTTVAGTLGVTGATTLSSSATVAGDFSVGSNTFKVFSSSGNTTVAGTLDVVGKVSTTNLGIHTIALNDGTSEVTLTDVNSFTAATTGTSTLMTITNAYKAVEFLVKCVVPSAGAYQMVKLLAVCDGASTTAVTEFGNVEIGETGVTYDVTASGGAMSLVATTTIANTSFTVIATAIK